LNQSFEKQPAEPQPAQQQLVRTELRATYSGPIPPPEMLAAYERALPGSAERIIEMAESEQKHRHSLESADLNTRVTLVRRGQTFAFILGFTGTLGGILIALFDKSLAGFSVFFTSLATLAGIYFYGQKQKPSKQPQRTKTA